MFINSAYINDSLLNCKDTINPLSVGSCGNYKLLTATKLPTYRAKGRLDYQLIYIAAGVAHFYFNDKGNDTIIPAGTFVLFRPKEYQRYVYYGSDHTEAFWIHFSGTNVKSILRQYGIQDDMHIIRTGTKISYADLFKNIIDEIQQRKSGYEYMAETYFRQLLIQLSRDCREKQSESNNYIQSEVEAAQHYFNEHYSEDINIDEYAASRGMSISWFIRNFKSYTGITPLQYILSRRIDNAQILLESTDYTINEISNIVGYDNQLYFSRLFRKQKGVSPSEYRKKIN